MAEGDPIQANAKAGAEKGKKVLTEKSEATKTAISEGNFRIRQSLSDELLQSMRQERALRLDNHRQAAGIRRIIFRCVMLPFAALAGLMMLGLGLAVYAPGVWTWFCSRSPLLPYFEKAVSDSSVAWPLGVFISGTFLSFVAVFGALAFGVFATLRKKSDESASEKILDALNQERDGGEEG